MITTTRRALTVLAAAGMLLAVAPSAHAASSAKATVEGTNWFWRSQNRTTISEETGESCPPEAPVCPDPQVGLRNTHSKGALPVQILDGKEEKISAVNFDLSFIPVQGAVIEEFTFTVIESADPQDQAQTLNAGGKTVLACLLTDSFADSEDGADEFELAPKYDCEAASVEGERDAEAGLWKFDITDMVQDWGADPLSANGVMLVGSQKDENWQVVLKGPRRDDPTTAEVDEEKENAKNIQASVVYTPNEEPADTVPDAPDDGGIPPTTPTFPTTTTTDIPTFGTDDGTFGADTTPATDVTPTEVPGTEAAGTDTAAPADSGPETPGYVWALIPLGLVAFALVRNSFAEPVAIRRPDGVVAMIRRQNADRRGDSGADAEGPFAGFKRFFSKTGRGLKRAATKRSGS
ncbi:MAG TPA: hypothetical protein VGB51_08925 [Actinomycetota bacterium]